MNLIFSKPSVRISIVYRSLNSLVISIIIGSVTGFKILSSISPLFECDINILKCCDTNTIFLSSNQSYNKYIIYLARYAMAVQLCAIAHGTHSYILRGYLNLILRKIMENRIDLRILKKTAGFFLLVFTFFGYNSCSKKDGCPQAKPGSVMALTSVTAAGKFVVKYEIISSVPATGSVSVEESSTCLACDNAYRLGGSTPYSSMWTRTDTLSFTTRPVMIHLYSDDVSTGGTIHLGSNGTVTANIYVNDIKKLTGAFGTSDLACEHKDFYALFDCTLTIN
jgi:hypothetical protein